MNYSTTFMTNEEIETAKNSGRILKVTGKKSAFGLNEVLELSEGYSLSDIVSMDIAWSKELDRRDEFNYKSMQW